VRLSISIAILIISIFLVSSFPSAKEISVSGIEKGLNALSTKKYEKAVIYFTNYIENEWKDGIDVKAFVLYFRSTAYRQQKKYDLALKDINDAIALVPDNPKLPLVSSKGAILVEIGDFRSASSFFDLEIHKNPYSFWALAGRADMYAEQQNFQKASDQMEYALEILEDVLLTNKSINPNEKNGMWVAAQGSSYFVLGTYQEKTGDIESAASSFQRSKKLGYKSDELEKKIRQYSK
jgi:tetratricopeptide (TPR) repeat protein